MRTWLPPLLAGVLALTGLAPVPPASTEVTPARVQMSEVRRPRWVWPTGAPVEVVRGFDPPAQRWLPGHRGIDLAIPPGSTLLAPAAGVVAFAGEVAGTPVLSIDHPGGIRSTFQPVSALVEVGEAVQAGQPVAILQPGHAGDTLHLGARIGRDTYLNPLRLLLGPIVLKPVSR